MKIQTHQYTHHTGILGGNPHITADPPPPPNVYTIKHGNENNKASRKRLNADVCESSTTLTDAPVAASYADLLHFSSESCFS